MDEQAISMFLLAQKCGKWGKGAHSIISIHVKKKNICGAAQNWFKSPAFSCHIQTIFEWGTQHLLVIPPRNRHQGACFSFVLTTARNFVKLMADPMHACVPNAMHLFTEIWHTHHSCFLRGRLLFWPFHCLTKIEHDGSLRWYYEDACVLKLKTPQSSSVLQSKAVFFSIHVCAPLIYSSNPIQRANAWAHFLCTDPLSTLSYLCQSSRDYLVSKCCCLLPHAEYIYWCLALWWYFTAL